MTISLTCSCGRRFRLRDELAGRKAKCPDCQAVLTVPQPDTGEEGIPEVEAVPEETGIRPSRASRAVHDEDEEPAPRRGYGVEERDEDEEPGREERRPRKKKPRRSRASSGVTFEQGWFGSINAGVIGGVLMLVIAVVWFVAGLAAGYIFFYPPILAVIGIAAIIKGLAGG